MDKKIAVLCPYPLGIAPGQRFRFEFYLKPEASNVSFFPFLSEKYNQILYSKGKFLQKTLGVLKGFIARVLLPFRLKSYDLIYIFREASPLGPPIFEWIIAKILHKRIIYDFDDAIWLPNTSAENRWIARLKWHGKVKWICKWAYKVSCGNAYLADFARQYNKNVFIIPTIVDTVKEHNQIKNQHTTPVTVGWTGSHSTLKYLEPIVLILAELEKELEFETVVIADKNPNLPLKHFRFVKWNKASEIQDLLRLHIGLMPLPDHQWAKGKCGFKAIQYNALGIPALVSPVGVNRTIIDHGENGYWCETEVDWSTYLRELITRPKLREATGKKGRDKMEKEFSVESQQETFLNLFE